MGKVDRIYNFSAGPSMLPLAVLEQAAKEMVSYNNSGMSVMEMSHRSDGFGDIIQSAEKDLRELMAIPDSYKVLFLQGGGSLQFSMIPMNLFRNSRKADYIVTGRWAKNAAKEARKLGQVNIVATSEDKTFTYIPDFHEYKNRLSDEADYCYITYNNTIYGTKYTELPNTGRIPLVADISSSILSEELDVTNFALLFAGAQKNIGPAGLTIVIIREDLLGFAPESTPDMLNYKVHADAKSLFNTPPSYSIYMAGLTFQWIKGQGGVRALEKTNREKADILYRAIDESKIFKCPISNKDRSLMNVIFLTGDQSLDKKFILGAQQRGLVNLGGHRSIGGMRASIYNAMPLDGVERLVDYMKDFEQRL